MIDEKLCIHCFVAGKVQGVWFRASTKTEADKLGLNGWVKNLPDGRVEVMACGEKGKIHALQEWLAQGPDHARVTDLSQEELPFHAYNRFEVL